MLVINPGSLSRESSFGTYCIITMENMSAQDFSAAIANNGELGVSAIASKRIRADIVKL